MKLEGPRRQVAHSPAAWYLWALIGVSGLVLVHDVLAEFDVVQWRQWVGVTAGATFVFAAVSLLIAHGQFAMTQAPYLRYFRGQDRSPEKASKYGPGSGPLWYVDVSNGGNGTATLRGDITYTVEVVAGDGRTVSRDGVGFRDMLAAVQSATGLTDEQHFVFGDWQQGMPIRAGEPPLRLWEMPLAMAHRIRRLDARLRYASLIGDVYELDVSCIPPRGLPGQPAAPGGSAGQASGNDGNGRRRRSRTRPAEPGDTS